DRMRGALGAIDNGAQLARGARPAMAECALVQHGDLLLGAGDRVVDRIGLMLEPAQPFRFDLGRAAFGSCCACRWVERGHLLDAEDLALDRHGSCWRASVGKHGSSAGPLNMRFMTRAQKALRHLINHTVWRLT